MFTIACQRFGIFSILRLKKSGGFEVKNSPSQWSPKEIPRKLLEWWMEEQNQEYKAHVGITSQLSSCTNSQITKITTPLHTF